MTTFEQVSAIRKAMDRAGAYLSREQAATVPYLFRPWLAVDKAGTPVHYETTERCRHNGFVYECRQAHDAQPQITPDVITDLWLRLDV